jgi:murein DD-endopeptidase MepM/ murein hydrolase activator NlpD
MILCHRACARGLLRRRALHILAGEAETTDMEERPPTPSGEGPREGAGSDAPSFDADAERRAQPAVPVNEPNAPARGWKTRARLRVVLVALPLLAAIVALVWYLSTRSTTTPVEPIPRPSGADEVTPAATVTPTVTPATTQTPAPDATPTTETPAPSPGADATPASPSSSTTQTTPAPEVSDANARGRLLVPVEGVSPEQLQDTFTESRSEGRAHDAIDIIAPRGTPVVAVADGRVIKLFQSVPGGITVYQLDPDNRTLYYYAHLERYADGLAEGQVARRGQTIGYVGDTGNAGPGNYHLHFSVSRVADPARWWEGENLNPYPMLTGRN